MGSWGFVFGNPGPYGITPGVTPTGAFIDPTALNPPFIVGRRLWDAFGNPLAVGGGGGNFGILDFSQLAPIFSLLKRDDKSTVTQAPKLLVLDNQQATIFVGETVRFAETFSTSNQQGGVEFGIREAANSPVQTGFQRLLIPHVIRELNQVILTVIPQFESLTQGNSVAHPGFDEYTSGTMTILLPRVSHQTVVTKLKMDSGQTAVMGGLVNEQDIDQIDKVPILGDLPFGGWAFKKKVTNKTKRNLFIFLTLHVLDRAQESRAAVAEKIETDNEFRTGKPLYLKERVIKDAQEKSRREEDSRKAYAPILRGSEFKPYEK
jgi:general secretion pathway protein D